jgi:TolB-like protein
MAIGNFLSELKRRNVYRVGAAYAVGAFVLVEVASNVTPALRLPDWTTTLVIVLLALGFPVLLCFAWVYEITPDGLKRTAEVEQNTSLKHQTGHRLNIVIIGLMVILAGLYGAQLFMLPDEAADGAARTSTEALPKATAAAPGTISIAVLPFVNLSSDPEQEFFSDGMTEEITSALAKVQSLRVVGRTSAFEFKGQNKDLRAIGQTLSTTHLLEGSVRKSGNRVRITAQLIKAHDGTHLWTQNYDRELTDIFAIQDEIAQAIARALRLPLGLEPGQTLVANREIDPENYQQYLRAKALFRARGSIGGQTVTQAVDLLEQLVTTAPDYAPAWALLSVAKFISVQETDAFKGGNADLLRAARDAVRPNSQAAARRALVLDPRNANAYVGLALSAAPGKLLDREDALKRALELEGSNPEVLQVYSLEVAMFGRVKEALALRETLRAIEPLVPVFNSNTSYVLWLDGQNQAALAMAKVLPEDLANRAADLARVYASMGKYREAADVLNEFADKRENAAESARFRAMADLLRKAPGPVRNEDLPDGGSLNGGGLNFVYAQVGAPERAAVGLPSTGIGASNYLHPSYAGVRKTGAFKAWARETGLVEYWGARGWPDVCRPVGADDFECD